MNNKRKNSQQTKIRGNFFTPIKVIDEKLIANILMVKECMLSHKIGSRQGYPLSSLFYNIIMEILMNQ